MVLRVNITGADLAAAKAPPDLGALEQQYGLPAGILGATSQVESGGNPRAVSPVGAIGQFQLMPATAKALGVDPNDPAQAADGAARLWRQNLDASGGDVDRAAMMYHGGPDTSKWGPKTNAYPGKLLAALGPAQPQHAPGNPFAAGAASAMDTPDAPPADHAPGNPFVSAAVDGGAGGSSSGGGANSSAGLPVAGGTAAGTQPIAAPPTNGMGGAAPSAGLKTGQAGPRSGSNADAPGLGDRILRGVEDVTDTGLQWGASGVDTIAHALGMTPRYGFTARQLIDAGIKSNETRYQAGRGASAGLDGGRIAGNIGGVLGLPFGLGTAELIPGAGVGARIGNAAIQGGIGGAATSSANPDQSAGSQAALGGAIGAGIGAVSYPAGRVASALEARFSPQIAKVVAAMRGTGSIAEDATGNVAQSAAPSPQDIAAAVSAGGVRRGLISDRNLPAPVMAHAQQLVGQGVPVAHAVREAEITHIGANPTVANTTRNFADQQATNEGAKIATPEGQALMARQTANNAASHSAVSNMVDGYGGVPSKGEAAATAQRVLSGASDAERGKVSTLYKTAQDADQSITVRPDALRETLASPDFQTPKTAAGQAFASGMRADLANVTNSVKGGSRGLGPTELERLRQSANAAYDPSAPAEVNSMVAKSKAAIDQAFDDLGGSSDAYKTARAAHKAWADAYDIPGVGDLIAKDASGAFVSSPYKLGNSMLANTDDRAFGNVVARLKANGNTDALDKLKASTLQDAYEGVNKGPQDAGGHAPLNGRVFLQRLDALGQGKLDALFSPAEQGHIATIGRAAMHLNDASPGAFNNSSTASTAINTLARAMEKAKPGSAAKGLGIDVALGTAAQGLGHAIWPGVGGAVAGGGVSAVKVIADALMRRSATKGLASALTEASNPAAARAAAIAKVAAAMQAAAAGRGVAKLAAPIAAAHNSRR